MIASPKKNDFESQVLEAKSWLCEDPRFQCLPRYVQDEILGEVLVKIFLRKLLEEIEFNRNYVLILFKFELRKLRCQKSFHTSCRGNEFISTDSESEGISRELEPIDQLIAIEERETDDRRLRKISRALVQLSPRWQSIATKWLRGEKLANSERSVLYRCLNSLRRLLTRPEN